MSDKALDFKCVWHKGSGITIHPDVLEALGLQDNQHITTDIFWRIVKLNAERSLLDIEARKQA